MKSILTYFVLILGIAGAVAGQTCFEAAKEVQPVMSQATKVEYEKKLDDARKIALTSPNGGDADSTIWYGRRTAYTGRYKDAIAIFIRAIKRWPEDARMYRHRGHRYLTLRCFDDAISDFTQAAKLTKGKTDEAEPDGLPNAKNIPTSTLQSNIWYHLGLAYYLKGDLKNAIKAYKECMKVSKNNDMLAATTHWYYMTLRLSGKHDEAKKLLTPFDSKFEVIENDDYLKLLRMYRGDITADSLSKELGDKAETLGNASLGYGLGNWYFYIGETEKSMKVFERIVAGNQWASFGYIAAEADLARKPRK